MNLIQFKLNERMGSLPLNVANAIQGSWAVDCDVRHLSIDLPTKFTSDLEVDYTGWFSCDDSIEYRLLNAGAGSYLSYIVEFFTVFTEEEISKMIDISRKIIAENIKQ